MGPSDQRPDPSDEKAPDRRGSVEDSRSFIPLRLLWTYRSPRLVALSRELEKYAEFQ